MSRSRRHVPIMGHAKSKSEKDDKQRASMTARKRLHNQLNPQTASAEGFDLQTGEDHPRSGQRTFAKDGKGYYKRATEKDMRK